jgi:CubicO group peptidase (beta-lactamase class C family)
MDSAEDVLRRCSADGRRAAVATLQDGAEYAVTAGIPDNAVFEIGSLNKVLTATVLASMVLDRLVSLETRLCDILPGQVSPTITLGSLATHTSGLPFLPDNLSPVAEQSPLDPYSGYSRSHMREALEALRCVEPGPPIYSNFGYMVLGEALAVVSATSFDNLVAARVLRPLGMADTRVVGTAPQRFVQPFADGSPVPPWNVQLRGAGGYEATVQISSRSYQLR